MFKIGDRVRIKNVYMQEYEGKLGTISGFDVGKELITVLIDNAQTTTQFFTDYVELIESTQSGRPVLGLVPQHIWRSQIVKLHKAERIKDISEAIKRYLDGELPIPELWLSEYNDLLSEVSK